MKLTSAANKFNTTVASDSYDNSVEFMVQFEPMSFSKIDGVSIMKRQLSVSPGVVVPARGCITIDQQVYLVGHGAPDFWKNSIIRTTLIIQGADGLADLTTVGDALSGTAPVTAYAAVTFAKYLPDAEDSSRYPPQYQIFLAGSESAPADSLVQLNSVWYLVKQSYISNSGLLVALANVVESPSFETATFGSRVYDPVTDAYTDTPTSIPVFRIKWSEHFKYLSKATEQYERGDLTVIMLKSVTPDPPDTLTLSDGVWRVLSSQDEGTTWSCHARRA